MKLGTSFSFSSRIAVALRDLPIYGLLKIFGGVLSLSRAFNYLRFSVRNPVFLWSVLDLPHLYIYYSHFSFYLILSVDIVSLDFFEQDTQ